MNKDELVIGEYNKLKDIFKNCDSTKVELADELMLKASFLKVELRALESQIKKQGIIQHSSKGNTRISIAYKTYLQSLTVYQAVIKSIDKIMGTKVSEEDDEFDEFIKRSQEGADAQ